MRATGTAAVGEWWMRQADKSRDQPAQLRHVLEWDEKKGARMADVSDAIFDRDGAVVDWTHGKKTWVSPETLGQPSKYRKVEAPRAPAVEPVAELSVKSSGDTIADLVAVVSLLVSAVNAQGAELRALRTAIDLTRPKQLSLVAS